MTELLIVEAGIRRLHARFIDAAWRKDAAAFAAMFAPDGEWKIACLHMHGRGEIHDMFAKLLGACEKVLIMLSTPLLDVDGQTATSRTFATEFAKMNDGGSAMTIGIYYDRYVELDGEWLFSWRHFGLQYRGPADLSLPFVESPDYGAFPGMPGKDDPTFTRRK